MKVLMVNGSPHENGCTMTALSEVARILAQEGYDCFNVSGGYRQYAAQHSDRLAAKQAMPCGADK